MPRRKAQSHQRQQTSTPPRSPELSIEKLTRNVAKQEQKLKEIEDEQQSLLTQKESLINQRAVVIFSMISTKSLYLFIDLICWLK